MLRNHMNKLVKFAISAGVIAPALMLAGTAFAATNIQQVEINGSNAATVPLGQTAQANVNFQLTGGTDAESMSWQIVDNTGNASLQPVCVDTADHIGSGTFNVSFPIGTGGQTEGTFSVRVKSYGDNGTGVDNQCNAGDLNDTFTQNDVLTITSPTDSTTVTGSPFTGNSTDFCALFPGSCNNANNSLNGGLTNNTGFGLLGTNGLSLPIFCQLNPVLCGITGTNGSNNNNNNNNGNTPPANSNAAKCSLIQPLESAQPYAYSSLGTQLQSALLLDNPFSIPALKPGSVVPMGFFGVQTHAALSAYLAMYHC